MCEKFIFSRETLSRTAAHPHIEEPVEMVWISGKDAPWTPP